ncbi:MAG: carboxypeptidase [Chloroflexi bacterium HGW-Chloroflexi-1]|nr:MAG: carboxypeptidase [Chloroflexi bacterium HGW-Chloroflexi-1]
MSRIRRSNTIVLVMAIWLVSALPVGAAAGAPPPPLYQVTLPAPDRAARTALIERGIAIDAVGPDAITTIVDPAGLARLLAQGLEPLSVTPLDFPPADSDYHNYAEMLAAIQAAADAHGDIVRVTTAGLSLEGRPIPAVKISDDPDLDDPSEPAVLFLALTHAREHLTVEMALAVIELFTAGYGVDPALTNLVNQREIWVLPNVNPDGGEYDVAGGYYLYWRKNRRPNGDGSYGVDLNRNYGYRWGGEGSSPYPSSETYRGPAAFSEPETQVVRDFVLAHPDITAAITFHTYAELILYPYGYTYLDQPPDMDPDDLRAFVSLAGHMAGANGYTAQQASDLYTTSGDAVDWLYG